MENKDNIKNVLEKIKNEELQIKSKNYFRLKVVALISIIIAVCVVSIFLASFIVFDLRAAGHISLIGFGSSGWGIFFILFPWKLFILQIILIIILESFLRLFRFGYKIPILHLLSLIILLMIMTGIVIDKTPLHDLLLKRADEKHLPQPFRDLYENVRRPLPVGHGILKGTIISVNKDFIVVELENNFKKNEASSVRVLINQDTSVFEIGSIVFIEGKIENGQIQARNIKIAGDSLRHNNKQ